MKNKMARNTQRVAIRREIRIIKATKWWNSYERRAVGAKAFPALRGFVMSMPIKQRDEFRDPKAPLHSIFFSTGIKKPCL